MDSWGPRWLSYQPEEEICNTVNTIHKTFATVTFRGHLCGGGGVWSTTSNLHLELVDIKHGCFLFDIFYRFNRPFSSWSLIMGYGKCADLFTASQSKLQFIWGNTSQVHMRDSWECCFVPVLQMSQWSARMAGGGGGEGATCGTCDAAHIRQHVKSILTYSVSLPGFRALLSPYSNSSYVMCDFKKIRKRCVRELFRKKAVTQRECFILRIRLGVEWGGVSFLINLKRTVWLSKLCTYITLIKF